MSFPHSCNHLSPFEKSTGRRRWCLPVLGLLGAAVILAAMGAFNPAAHAGTVSFTSHSNPVLNPERGLYGHGPLNSTTNFDAIRAGGCTLAYAPIDLSAYRKKNITSTYLNTINSAFGRMRSAGVKGIVRIVYNTDGTKDTTLAWVQTHLTQLQPILANNADVIAFFQAGIIGAWGEWHSSTSGLDTPAGRAAVWSLLNQYLPPSKFIQVRTPGYVNELEALDVYPLDDTTAFAGTSHARIAHHNDCFLASDTDYGTYPPPGSEQDAIKAQLEQHTRYVPWGGETCAQSAYSTCSNALYELGRFHATYLNSGYNPDVIADLQAGGCWDTIINQLGYRFELIDATLPSAITPGQSFSVQIRLQNTGWAPPYNARPVFLRLQDASASWTQDLWLSTADPRFWRPEAGVITINETLAAPASIPASQVTAALWMPDAASSLCNDPDYSIQMANTGVWDATYGQNVLTTSLPVATPASIVIDGQFGDWASVPVLLTDPSGDSGAAVADYTQLQVASDSNYIYLRIQTSNSVNLQGSGLCNIFLDCDLNSATGFQALSGRIGSELMIQASQGYQQKNGGFNEGQITSLGYTQAPTAATTDVEIRISRQATFVDGVTPIFGATGFNLILESENTSWVTEETAPGTGTAAYTF